jgi:predicted lipoprotein with Yx(FWY)xxD motif
MSRFKALPPLLVALAVLTAVSGATAASTASTISTVSNSLLGTKIIVDAGGYTVYHLTSETKGVIGCTGACRKVWPPLLLKTGVKLVAGGGLSASKLGTVKRSDGGVQVTYNHLGLYLYSGDKRPGQANGQGTGGKWYAITPAGVVTRAKLKQSGSGSALGGSSSSSGGSSAGSSGGSSSSSSGGSSGSTGSSGGSGSSGSSGGSAGSTQACGPGQSIPQGTYSGDGDDDNNGGADDGDGCL